MTDGTTYIFYVNNDDTITPDTNNGKAVTWDAEKRQFTVCNGAYVIKFSPGKGMTKISGITFTSENQAPIQVTGSEMTDSAQVLGGPWEFTISWVQFSGDDGSTDPKIYNDGMPPPTL